MKSKLVGNPLNPGPEMGSPNSRNSNLDPSCLLPCSKHPAGSLPLFIWIHCLLTQIIAWVSLRVPEIPEFLGDPDPVFPPVELCAPQIKLDLGMNKNWKFSPGCGCRQSYCQSSRRTGMFIHWFLFLNPNGFVGEGLCRVSRLRLQIPGGFPAPLEWCSKEICGSPPAYPQRGCGRGIG